MARAESLKINTEKMIWIKDRVKMVQGPAYGILFRYVRKED